MQIVLHPMYSLPLPIRVREVEWRDMLSAHPVISPLDTPELNVSYALASQHIAASFAFSLLLVCSTHSESFTLPPFLFLQDSDGRVVGYSIRTVVSADNGSWTVSKRIYPSKRNGRIYDVHANGWWITLENGSVKSTEWTWVRRQRPALLHYERVVH